MFQFATCPTLLHQFRAMDNKPRYNLWVVDEGGSKVVCHGSRTEMKSIASGMGADFIVLPDGREPNHPKSRRIPNG